MTAGASLEEHLKEQLAPLGLITIRRMFGGAGVYADGQIFALLSDDRIYFKADDGNRADFAAAGLGPFTYARGDGEAMLASYWQAPERLLDDNDEMLQWARKAVAAAQRSARAKKPVAAKRGTHAGVAGVGDPRQRPRTRT